MSIFTKFISNEDRALALEMRHHGRSNYEITQVMMAVDPHNEWLKWRDDHDTIIPYNSKSKEFKKKYRSVRKTVGLQPRRTYLHLRGSRKNDWNNGKFDVPFPAERGDV